MKNALVLYNHIPNLLQSYQERVSDITDFYMSHTIKNFDFFETSTLTLELTKLAEQGYQYAIINAYGHCVQQAIYDDLITDCFENDTPLMCHIMAKPFIAPYFDSQLVVIDLQIWQDVGAPPFEAVDKNSVFESVDFERSEENFHDDYTPYWIKPTTDRKKYLGHGRPFGSMVTQAFLEAGHSISNFSKRYRDVKFNLYADQNVAELTTLFSTGEYISKRSMPVAIEQILKEKATLDTTIYVLNTEDIYYHTPRLIAPVEHYVGVAGGFKGVLLLDRLKFTEKTVVTYIDISQPALDYQKYLIDHWDGNLGKYDSVVYQYQQDHHQHRCIWRSWNTWQEEIDSFLHQAGISRVEFIQLWQKYQQLTHNFMKIDLLDPLNQNQLVDHIKLVNGASTYIWVSNAFHMQWTRLLLGKQHTQTCFSNFYNLIKQIPKNQYIIESSGYFYKAN